MAVNYYYFSLVLCFFVSSLMWKWKTRLHFCLRENSVTGTQVKLINKVVLSNKCKIQRWTDQQNLTFWNERLSIKSSSKYPSPQNLFFKNFSRWCFNQRNLLSCSSLGNIFHTRSQSAIWPVWSHVPIGGWPRFPGHVGSVISMCKNKYNTIRFFLYKEDSHICWGCSSRRKVRSFKQLIRWRLKQ